MTDKTSETTYAVAGTPKAKPAVVVFGTDRTSTVGQIDRRSNQLAHFFRDRGLQPGDRIAILLKNCTEYLEIVWGAQRAGLIYVPVNWHLTGSETTYIVSNSDAQILFVSAELVAQGPQSEEQAPSLGATVVVGAEGLLSSGIDYAAALSSFADVPIADEVEGVFMFYSSGTTGRPKGIARTVEGMPFGTGLPMEQMLIAAYGISVSTVYLTPAPLYHAAPLGWCIAVARAGGTLVVMERFDAIEALRAIEEHRVTHVQFTPTMFVRMLKLDKEIRESFDMSSLQVVVHAGAPCPVDVKYSIIDWFGPIVYEYYSGSEANTYFVIDSQTWLQRPGSVGRAAVGSARILDDDGRSLPTGAVGTVWFEGGPDFAYHKDPIATAKAHNDSGWTTLGDMGRLDEDGYLYLMDRRADLILTGGVNVYPREVEEVLISHPNVADAAVFGVPDDEMGQAVKAVVALRVPSTGQAAELIDYCRSRLAHFKCPRSVDFTDELPRLPSGKLLRRVLQEQYWSPAT